MGYNLKMTDMQAAIGVAQLDKLPAFIEARSDNFWKLNVMAYDNGLSEWFELPYLAHARSPFGYPLLCKSIDRNKLCRYLDEHGVGTRPIMGGNLLRHPIYKGMDYFAGDLTNSDNVYDNGFWIGCWPGLDHEQLEYAISKIAEYCRCDKKI
jgi:CDP-6-deoxy-D-xylo-4-hexulose-3-dehydrase